MATLCPYMRAVGKTTARALLSPDLVSTAAKCPHLTATNTSPLTALAKQAADFQAAACCGECCMSNIGAQGLVVVSPLLLPWAEFYCRHKTLKC